MIGMINIASGLSEMGKSVSSWAHDAGMQQMKTDLEYQQTLLADQLARNRDEEQFERSISAPAIKAKGDIARAERATPEEEAASEKSKALARLGVETSPESLAAKKTLAETEALARAHADSLPEVIAGKVAVAEATGRAGRETPTEAAAREKALLEVRAPYKQQEEDYKTERELGAFSGVPGFDPRLDRPKTGVTPSGTAPVPGAVPSGKVPVVPTQPAAPTGAAAQSPPNVTPASGATPPPVTGAAGSDTAPPPGVPDAAGGDYTPGPAARAALNNSTGEEFLKTLPPGLASVVKGYAEGRIAFPSGAALRSPNVARMMDAVARYDPTFDATNYNVRNSTRKSYEAAGPRGAQVGNLNTAVEHLYTLLKAVPGTSGVGPNSLVGLLGQATNYNALMNKYSEGSGRSGVPVYKQTLTELAGEMTKLFRGATGAEADIIRNVKNMNEDYSTQTKMDLINNAVDIMSAKLDNMAEEYNHGMNTNHQPLEFLKAKPRVILQILQNVRRDGIKALGVPVEGQEVEDKNHNKGIWHDGKAVPITEFTPPPPVNERP